MDRSVYGPFKAAFDRAVDGWMRSIFNIPTLVNEAHLSATTPRNVLSGFKNTGIYPYNRDLFGDTDFAATLVTDRPITVTQPGHKEDQPDSTDSTSSLMTLTASSLTGAPSSSILKLSLMLTMQLQMRSRTARTVHPPL